MSVVVQGRTQLTSWGEDTGEHSELTPIVLSILVLNPGELLQTERWDSLTVMTGVHLGGRGFV